MKQLTTHSRDVREIERPQSEVYQVNTQIDDTTTAGNLTVIEPLFVRAVSIVENQIHREDSSQLSTLHQLAHLQHFCEVPIRQVHAEQAIHAPRSLDYFRSLLPSSSQRFLAKHCDASS